MMKDRLIMMEMMGDRLITRRPTCSSFRELGGIYIYIYMYIYIYICVKYICTSI